MIKYFFNLILCGLTIFILTGCEQSKERLYVYTWSDYIDPELITQFEKENNCYVVIDTYDSNESMYAKIKAGACGYDIIFPTSYMAKVMYEQKLIEKLDLTQIPNVKYIDTKYLTNLAFDKTMEYSIPYMLGYTCIAYNKQKLGNIEASWNVFNRKDLKGRMTLLDDYRETIGAGLMYLGYGINSLNDEELTKAEEQIRSWKKNLAKFDNEVYKIGIVSGEFLIVQGYSGDLLQVIAEAKHIDTIIPKEGVSISCDDMVIPVSASGKKLAYKFINFMSDPRNAAANMDYNQFFAPVYGAKEHSKNVNLDKIFPEELYSKGKLIKDLGKNNKKYQDTWDSIKRD
jgi:spermidine/putrescine transport system substrate-binding protein